MYSSGYSQVSRHSPLSQKKRQYRSKSKGCGYYMRIVFFFSSLIQSLIIVSLVLFLVYGKTQDSASTSRIQDLEESFSRLSIENVALRQLRNNLTNLLNTTLTEKARNDFDLAKLRSLCNISILFFQDYERKLQQCNRELLTYKMPGYNMRCPEIATIPGNCNCGFMVDQLQARVKLVQSNFTQTVQRMRMEMDWTAKERDDLSLETIRLRRDKSMFEKELELYRKKSKDDFTNSLKSVSNVSRAFLLKIESLFPSHIAFQITCPKQIEHLEQIRTNCTSLSREVEDKLQDYMNIVGDEVSGIKVENIRLKAENWRLSEDYRWCSQNRTGMTVQHKQNMDKLQHKHDTDKQRILMEKMKLIGEVEVLENNVKYKSKEVDHLTEQVRVLNMTCMAKAPQGGSGFPGLVPSRSGTQSQSSYGSYGGGGSNSYGRTGTGGLGSNIGSGSSLSKPSAGIGTGSSFSSSGSTSGHSSPMSGFNKPVSSTGVISGYGSSALSTSLGSSGIGAGSGTSLSSSNTGSNKQTSSSSSSSGSYGSPNSSGSSRSSSSYGSAGSSSSSGSSRSSSSYGSSGSSSSYGSAGSSSSSSSSGSYGSSGSSGSTGSSTGYGSSGYSSNKQTSPGGKSTSLFGYGSSSSGSSGSSSSSGSTGTSSSSGSAGSSRSSTGSTGSTGSSGSTGSTNKSGSSSGGLGWFGLGSSTSGQSKPGSVPGKSTSSSGSSTSSGGRTSGLAGTSMSLTQHIQEMRHLLNPPGPDDKQDLSFMLG